MEYGGSSHDLLKKISTTISRFKMLEPGQQVLVACSGGPDSVGLLHALVELDFAVTVAHLDHGTRAGESALDAAFVRRLAEGLALDCEVERREVEAEARACGESFERYARRVRYDFLTGTAKRLGITTIATGHHAGDVAETVMLRLLRGTGPGGLAGIPPVRESRGVRIVRPLIECARREILEYLSTRDIPYREDATNRSRGPLRNRVRNELLPQLAAEYNPRLYRALFRLAEIQRDEDALLSTLTGKFLAGCIEKGRIKRQSFALGPVALQRRALSILTLSHGVECTFDQIESARRFILDMPAGKRLELTDRLTLVNSRGLSEFVSREMKKDERVVPLRVPGVTQAFNAHFDVHPVPPPSVPLRAYCSASRQIFDADTLGSALAVRTRQWGDRFMPLGMGGEKKLKDYFADLGLSATERNETLLLVSGGRIAWVIGHAIDARFAVRPETRHLTEVEVRHAAQ